VTTQPAGSGGQGTRSHGSSIRARGRCVRRRADPHDLDRLDRSRRSDG
jgi:hypothetical protein